MIIEDEIEKSKKRIALLEHQNAEFKHLLDKAVKITEQSNHDANYDNNEFFNETITLIEKEKLKLVEDLSLLTIEPDNAETATQETLAMMIRQIQAQLNAQAKEIEELNRNQSELKFLLTNHNNNELSVIKTMLTLEENSDSNAEKLMIERSKLQDKILKLEKRKSELLSLIKNMTSSNPNSATVIQDMLQTALDKSLVKSPILEEYKSLNSKLLQLEEQRSYLLTELQVVLDKSRKEIADEYKSLQQKINDIETEKIGLRMTLQTLQKTTSSSCTKIDSERLANIFNAFRNVENDDDATTDDVGDSDGNNVWRIDQVQRYLYRGGVQMPYCTIL